MKKTKTGFTMMELLVVMGIMAILVVVMTEMLQSILVTRLESGAESAVDADIRYSVSRLQYDLARANSISAPNEGVTTESLSLVIDGSTYVYSVIDNQLWLTIDGGESGRLQSTVSTIEEFSVTRMNNQGGKQSVRIVKTAIFRTGGPAATGTEGFGYLVDNLSLSSSKESFFWQSIQTYFGFLLILIEVPLSLPRKFSSIFSLQISHFI